MNTEKTAAANEALLMLLNQRKPGAYVATVVDTKLYLHRAGDEKGELSVEVVVRDSGNFSINQYGRHSLGTRARRYDDRSVECDTLDEAYRWVQRRLSHYGKKLDEAKAALAEQEAREAMRKVTKTARVAIWKAQVAEHSPGARVHSGTWNQERAIIAGKAGYTDNQLSVEASNLDTRQPDMYPVTARVRLDFDDMDPVLALKFADGIALLADGLGIKFDSSRENSKPYSQAFTKEEE